jgi:glutamate/tyrosine decarboxylase-like PLP-dependent enzyme
MQTKENTQLQNILQQLMDEVIQVQNGNTMGKVLHPIDAQGIRKHLSAYTFESAIDVQALFSDVTRMMQEWNIQITHPRYFGLFNPATTLISIIADTLVALYNPQLAAWSHSPAANEIERHTLHYLASKFGFPSEGLLANFTSGGSEANFTAMLAALAHQFPHYLSQGLVNLGTQPVFYVSEFAHNSFDKICKNVGIGLQSMRVITVTDSLQMDTEVLQKQIEHDKQNGCTPFLIVGTAGTTSTGVIDPLEELATISKANNIWYHVDAAWAGAIVFSQQLKPLIQGIENADSVTMDAHKWFSVPFGAGMFFSRHTQSLLNAFSVRADYMPKSQLDTLDPYTSTIQWTRRFMGLKLFMTLAESGQAAFAQLLEEQVALGNYLRDQLSKHGWMIVNNTDLPVICFTHPLLEKGHILIEDMLQQIYQEGKVWISVVTLKHKQKAFRACITHYKTNRSDMDFLVTELDAILRQKLRKTLNP